MLSTIQEKSLWAYGSSRKCPLHNRKKQISSNPGRPGRGCEFKAAGWWSYATAVKSHECRKLQVDTEWYKTNPDTQIHVHCPHSHTHIQTFFIYQTPISFRACINTHTTKYTDQNMTTGISASSCGSQMSIWNGRSTKTISTCFSFFKKADISVWSFQPLCQTRLFSLSA